MLDTIFLPSLLHNLLFLPVFALAIYIACYIPGRVVLGNIFKKKSKLENVTLSLVVGMTLWGLQGIIFGYLNLRYLTYVYLFIFAVLWFVRSKFVKFSFKNNRISILDIVKRNCLLILIFTLGIFGQTQAFFISGFVFSEGIYMFTGSSDDSFWHTSLINQLVSNFPPEQPGLSGELVKNYHYVSNLIVGDLIRVFKLPLLATQYQFIYLLISILLGLAAYTLGKSLGLSKKGLVLIVYLQYFTSDIIYLISYFGARVFEFTVHPLEDGTMLLENPPRAFASIFSLVVVILLIEFQKRRDIRTGIILSLVSGIIIGLKVHHGFLILSGLAFLSLYFFYKKEFKSVISPLTALLISLLIYLPVNKGAGAPILVLFDMARMLVGQDKLGLTRLELARQIYEQHGNTLQVWRMYLTMQMIFLLAQFGIKNIGFIPFAKTLKTLTFPVAIFLYGGIVSTIFFGTFFIQPVAGADIFNFFLSASLFLGVITAVTLDRWFAIKYKPLLLVLVIVLLIATIPRWVYKTSSVKAYLANSNPVISSEELKAFNFARENISKNSRILVFNKGQWDSMYPYVSVFTNGKMYLSGQVILGRHGIDIKKREKIVEKLQNTKNKNVFQEILSGQNIKYLYFYNDPYTSVKIDSIPGKKIFYNNTITIYEIN